jgi:hypothetical protein
MKIHIGSLVLVGLIVVGPTTLAQGQGATQDRGYIGQMSEEQVRQKLAGEGFSRVSDLKKIPVTKYRWTAKALKSGKEVNVTIDEFGHVSAK